MPFTLSHIAAIHPFRKRVPIDALVIGSIVPDSSYFITIVLTRNDTHSLLSIFYYSLPLGLLLLFLFRKLLKKTIYTLLPCSIKRCNLVEKSISNKNIISIIALLIGISTHIFWDFLTHLTKNPYPQHFSSIIGLLLLIFIIKKNTMNWFLNFKLLFITTFPLLLALVMATITMEKKTQSIQTWFLYWIIFEGGKLLVILILLYSLLYNLYYWRSRKTIQ